MVNPAFPLGALDLVQFVPTRADRLTLESLGDSLMPDAIFAPQSHQLLASCFIFLSLSISLSLESANGAFSFKCLVTKNALLMK